MKKETTDRKFVNHAVGKPWGKRSKFNPSHSCIDRAVKNYLSTGGKITRIEMDEEAYTAFVKMRDAQADDFLNGKGF